MNNLSVRLLKISSQNDCVIFWDEFKKFAEAQEGGIYEGAFKTALEIWSDLVSDSVKTASFDDRNAIANNIATSIIAERAISKIAGLNDQDRQELIKLNAELNVFLLREMTKEALTPTQIGALVGGVGGAGIGTYEVLTDDKPLATVAARALPGAVIGGLAGAGYSELKDLANKATKVDAKSQAELALLNAKAQAEAQRAAEHLKMQDMTRAHADQQHAANLALLGAKKNTEMAKGQQLLDSMEQAKKVLDAKRLFMEKEHGALVNGVAHDPQLQQFLNQNKDEIITHLMNGVSPLDIIKTFRANMPRP